MNEQRVAMHRQPLAGVPASFRFREPIENEFRAMYLAGSLPLIRGALLIGFLFGFAMLALDYWIADPGFNSWSTPVRAAVTQSLVLVMLFASFDRASRGSLPRLGIAVGLCIAATYLSLSVFGPIENMASSFTGYVIVTFYIYFFLGQRFAPAVITASPLFVSFVGASYLQGEVSDLIIYGTYLAFVNLICAICSYSYEAGRRKLFVESLTLKDMARRDSLTGLANRKALDEYLESIWSYARREGQPLALAMIDIDHFKAFNDHYGHQAGDRCLAAVADIVGKGARRPLDFTARFGGEEFVLVLPGPSIEAAEKITDYLRRQIVLLNIPHETSPTAPYVTVSAGLAHVDPQSTSRSIDGLIQLADQALYDAKQRGRNRVIVSGMREDLSTQTGFFLYEKITNIN